MPHSSGKTSAENRHSGYKRQLFIPKIFFTLSIIAFSVFSSLKGGVFFTYVALSDISISISFCNIFRVLISAANIEITIFSSNFGHLKKEKNGELTGQ